MSSTFSRPVILALLIDVSGNLHVGSKPTSNAVQAFQRLRESRLPFRLCSNTSKESTTSLIIRLKKLGFEISSKEGRVEVWTSIGSVKHILQKKGLKRPFLLLSKSAREEISAEPQGQSGEQNIDYDSVVVGLAPGSFNYENLNSAFRILVGEHQEGHEVHSSSQLERGPARIPLIATHKAKYIQMESPPGLSLGPGPFVTALEYASGVQAHVVGKPTKTFFQSVIGDFYASGELSGPREGRIAVIGDDVEADLGEGALDLGLWRVLVKTGKYRAGDENRPGIAPPDEVFDSFSSFVDSLLCSNNLVS
ncbi:HAD-like domain-containing protein [Cyathus striatus]|nr:HAD-like domain-containing protein [Cyathus striatus]